MTNSGSLFSTRSGISFSITAQTFVDTDEMLMDDREDEANLYARRCIVPDEKMEEFETLTEDRDRVLRFSVRSKMAAGLTVGQLQKRRIIGPDKLNYLKRRWSWERLYSCCYAAPPSHRRTGR
jgi:hypothetical protein